MFAGMTKRNNTCRYSIFWELARFTTWFVAPLLAPVTEVDGSNVRLNGYIQGRPTRKTPLQPRLLLYLHAARQNKQVVSRTQPLGMSCRGDLGQWALLK
jgi:hypothetical protein